MAGTHSAWLWADEATPPAADLADFARARAVRDVFLSVPWTGPDASTRAIVAALGSRGIPCACLGGAAEWAVDPALAAVWARRATANGMFHGVHLDIEPWTRADWPARADALLDGLTRAVRSAAAATALPVDVDLPGWLARTHPQRFAAVASAARGVTVMAYRDRAPDILREAAEARRLAGQRPVRLGVDTLPADDPRTTFFDDGAAVLDREAAAVVAAAKSDPRFTGIAVHDLAGWRALRP